MKNYLLIFSFLISFTGFSQTHTMMGIILEENQEEPYLEMEEAWQIAADALVKNDFIEQWSVWKRTPNEGYEDWADYYVFIRTSADQDTKQSEIPWNESEEAWSHIYGSFKGKSKSAVDDMLNPIGVVKELRSRDYKLTSTTGWRGLEWKIGDKAYFYFASEKNEDFVSYETALRKPIAQQEILDGTNKFWGLFQVVGENKIWGSKSTHLVMNFTIGEKKVSNALSSQDFITQKDKEGLVNSRDITAEQELTLVYSTFDTN